MKKRFFTLVELLVVIGIILLLAGLLVPAVSGVQKQGRVTQTKSDMSTISMALSALAADNGGQCTTFTTSRGKSKCSWNGSTYNCPLSGGPSGDSKNMILELSNPSTSAQNNKRRIRYLDPTVDGSGNETYWPDPWGNYYAVLFCTDGSGEITPHGTHKIFADFALYSWGPNGTDETGCNVDADNHGTSAADDIATWHK